ncbi:hypothetical protein JCM10212_006500 [Sporobolomyces blumeae]
MNTRKAVTIMVTLIALILVGTVVVLTTVVQYFGVDSRDIITELEMNLYERLASQASRGTVAPGQEKEQRVVSPPTPPPTGGLAQGDVDVVVSSDDREQSVNEFMDDLEKRGWLEDGPASLAKNSSGKTPQPRIPKIIHATWKTDVLPDRWEKIRQGCIDLHPDYEFMLWSDASSRDFIAEYYPWFLSTFDGYTYPIQRADVIRYFVLHRFGGVYMDLDIGCRRNMDPLLYFEVILPQTIPVGVSNDLMFAERGHPFMDLVIHNLITFDHTYGTNYPTVMFSTGPMFLSAQYGLWPKDVAEGMERQVRVLPRRWYGKNARPSQMTDSFFDHYYGSSWHADDAGFITFLGKFGILLMYAGLAVVVLGLARLLWSKRFFFRSSPRVRGPIALPHGTPASANEALPFIRPDTPSGSRPATPCDGGSRSATPNGRPQANRPGLLYYLPVWVMPPSDRSPGGSNSPNPGHANWSQYFSNLSFVDPSDENRYQPIPSFSRPPSPSNNSILHAPGSMHDGAFDGVQLHSIQAPQPTRPQPRAQPQPTSSSAAKSEPLPSPSSPRSPPAYSTLQGLGGWLFRPSHSTSAEEPGTGVDHVNPATGRNGAADAGSLGARTFDLDSKEFAFGPSASSGRRTPGLGFRPRSPIAFAPEYSAAVAASSRTSPSVSAHPSRSATPSPQGPSAPRAPTPPEHGTEFGRRAGPAEAREPDGSVEFDEARGGLPLEEEVDRLLNEMAPDVDLEKGEPRS